MTDPQVKELEQHVLHYRHYDDFEYELSPKNKRDSVRSNRAHRLRLLRAITDDRRSPRVRRLVLEEDRALPGVTDWDVGPVEVSWVGTSMTADQMQKATDHQIFILLDKISKVQHQNVDASLAFAEFAKREPARAIGLFDRFVPRQHDSATAHALRELAAIDTIEPDRLLRIIHQWSIVVSKAIASVNKSDGLSKELLSGAEVWDLPPVRCLKDGL